MILPVRVDRSSHDLGRSYVAATDRLLLERAADREIDPAGLLAGAKVVTPSSCALPGGVAAHHAVADQHDVGGSAGEQADRDDTGDLVQLAFESQRIGDHEVVHVEDVTAVVRHEPLAPHCSTAVRGHRT